MEYFSRRNKPTPISREELYNRVCALIEDYLIRDYFKGQLGISGIDHAMTNFDSINRKSLTQIGFKIFPIRNWNNDLIDKNRITTLTTQPIIQGRGKNCSKKM
jgi:hypothetical protein